MTYASRQVRYGLSVPGPAFAQNGTGFTRELGPGKTKMTLRSLARSIPKQDGLTVAIEFQQILDYGGGCMRQKPCTLAGCRSVLDAC
jgi:hypothetical protein